MHAVLYRSRIVTIVCVCWTLVNARPPMSTSFVSPITAVPSGRYEGNDFCNLAMLRPLMPNKSNAIARSGRNGFNGGLVVNSELGKHLTAKLKLDTRKSSAEFDQTDMNIVFKNYGVSMATVKLYNNVFRTLKRHLFDCLQVTYDGSKTSNMLSEFIEFVSIEQNLLNHSVGLLYQSRLDITQVMRLYLFFCGPFRELDYSKKGGQISIVQNDMKEKFKDIIGDEPMTITYNISHTNQLQTLKKKTEDQLLALATSAVAKFKTNGQLLPGTPLHFVCIELLKWTKLMKSDNDDAKNLQNSRIIVGNTCITMRRYAESLRYEIDIDNLGRLNYEVLLRVNNILLYYLHMHFVLSANLINTHETSLKVCDPQTTSLVIARIYSFRPFLEIFNLYFVTRYLDYVGELASQTKLMALINFTDRFKIDLGLDLVHAIQELQTRPEKTVYDINRLLNEFTMSFLQDLDVKDSQQWIDGVNREVLNVSADISSALEANKEKAQEIIALCVKDLNPNWPNTKVL